MSTPVSLCTICCLAWKQLFLCKAVGIALGFQVAPVGEAFAGEEQVLERLETACAYALKLGVLPFSRLKSIITNEVDLRLPL